ncbi:TMEM175 family protein [Methanoregula sp.]|uniref:TMEM175 family protein n=1 Tax=Methanoregula sp. TaxID=2052170 RepID=UPI003562F8BB
MPGTDAEGPVTKTNIGRLTNTIFVFAFFLLFKLIRFPTYQDWVANATAHDFGMGQAPVLLNFLNVFLILAIIWIVAFHVFHQYRLFDRMYLYLHFALLMFIIFIPITSQHALLFSSVPEVFYLFHLNMLAIGIVIALEWLHCIRNPALVGPAVTAGDRTATSANVLVIPITALAGLLMIYFDIPCSQYIYIATILALILIAIGNTGRVKKFLGEMS